MSITVTIEELRSYESAMEKWYAERMKFAEGVRVVEDSFSDSRTQQLKWKQSLEAFIQTNPAPKLIPSV